ncbi:hypothetical protein AB5N96_12195 [Chryseomicrobium imtechense]
MKKVLLVLFLLAMMSLLVACNSNDEESNKTNESKEVFTDEDIQKAEDMVLFLNERLASLESEVNQKIEDKELQFEDEKTFNESVQELASKTIFTELEENYGDAFVSGNSDDVNNRIYFNTVSSEPCSLGHCEYDGIETMEVEVSDTEEYQSTNFNVTELVFVNANYKYENTREEESAEIRFVKTKDGQLMVSSHPALDIKSIDLRKFDEEYNKIQSNVPESEVESEQEEYRDEVKEILDLYPELQ